ncbi:MAG: DUF5666 domain-containing protein [Anaerolineae bacterium]|nr:DUF5666 domain-containing protein [Candidatus Roseilinea sp.]MDW8448874.1 DUF5666 domain-containing protein [Anaerolineae bacterium]
MKRLLGLIAAGVLMLAAVVLMAALPAQAKDDPPTQIHRGIINSRPAGNIGTWVIGGRAFVANANTEFDTDEGPLVVGACAKVRYFVTGGGDIADEIDSEPPQDCGLSGSPSPTPSVTPTPSATPVMALHRGLVESRPVGLLGEWTIGGLVFLANNDTEFDFDEGPLTVGSCAKVRYFTSNGVRIADEIDSEPQRDCAGGTPAPPPTITPNPREDSKVFARIDAFPPAPYIGVWRIGGVEYQANSRTEFEQEDGPFAVGACVKAEFMPMNGVNVLEEVETEDDRKCQGAAGEPVNTFKAYGVIDRFTMTVPSTWVISGISYTVSASTKLEAEHGPFRVGAFVEVRYGLANGERVATKIETRVAPGTGSNNTLGTLDSRPSDDWGVWVISGVSYQGDPAIRVELPRAALSAASPNAAGQKVFINSYVANGVNMLTLIRAMPHSVYMPAVVR